mgnify:CR=1 FL=1
MEDLEYDREKRSVRGERRRDRDHRSDRRTHNHTKVSADNSSAAASNSAAANNNNNHTVTARGDNLTVTVRQTTPQRNITQEGKNRIAAFLSKSTNY